MKIFGFLCNNEYREELEKYLLKNVPELIECDPNNHIHKAIRIIRGEYPSTYFSLVMTANDEGEVLSNSYQTLMHRIDKNFDLNELDTDLSADNWGFHRNEGMKYPNLKVKVKRHIEKFILNKKLKKVKKF